MARLRQQAADGSAAADLPPIVAVDPHTPHPDPPCCQLGRPGLLIAGSLAEARGLLDPDRTVVHLCTPPPVRSRPLQEAAELGFTRFIVEKPLAATASELQAVLEARRRYSLQVSVVAPWLYSTLTERLTALRQSGTFGRLHTMTVIQHKARFGRTLANRGHHSALDVEIPHSLGLALHLAGDAEVVSAATTDLEVGGTIVPAMGSAGLELRHHGGVWTTITSDLTAPERRRRVVLELSDARITADYPVGQDDDHAQLRVVRRGHRHAGRETGRYGSREVLRDDALGTFLARTYQRYADGGGDDAERHVRACELLDDAKRRAAALRARQVSPGTAPEGKEAPGTVYAGITDEAGDSLDDQLAAIAELGWSAVELRTVGGTPVAELGDATFRQLAERLRTAGLRVVCLDSRIGDWSRPISHPFEADLTELRVLARRCRAVDTRFIRVMSYPNDALTDRDWYARVLERFRILTAFAEAHDLVLLHENCSGWAGSQAERMLDLLQQVGSPALALLFDTGNGVPHGYQSTELLAPLLPHIRHVHIKDAVRGREGVTYTLPGHGAARVADCLRMLFAHGYAGALSIEPHLTLRPHESRTAANRRAAEFIACGRELERLVGALPPGSARPGTAAP